MQPTQPRLSTLLLLLNAVSLSAIPVNTRVAAEMIGEFMELSSKVDPALPVNATREYVLDKTAATIVDKYAAPLAFLETESTRRMIKRHLSPAFREGDGAYLHRVTSAKVLAELEKLSETLSPDELERGLDLISDIFEWYDGRSLKDVAKGMTETAGQGIMRHTDVLLATPAMSRLDAEDLLKLQSTRDEFKKTFEEYKKNEDAIFAGLVKKYLPALEAIDKWYVTAKQIAKFIESLGECDIWKFGIWDVLKTAFLESSIGSPIKLFTELAEGKFKKHWEALSEGFKVFSKMEDDLKRLTNTASPAKLLESFKSGLLLQANVAMKTISTMLGLSCEALWTAVKASNPLVDAFSTVLATVKQHCPAISENEGDNFGIAMSVGLDAAGMASPFPLPVNVGASAGVEVGVGLSANGQHFCFTGAAVGVSATLGEVGYTVGAGLTANVQFFQDANEFVGTSNSVGFSGGASLAVGAGIEFDFGLNFGLRDYMDKGDGIEELMEMEAKDLLKEMLSFNSIGISVSTGVQVGVSAGLPLSMDFGFGWTPVCVDTEGNACGRKDTKLGWTEKQWDGLHAFWKEGASSDMERGARRPGVHHLAAETEALESALESLSDAIA